MSPLDVHVNRSPGRRDGRAACSTPPASSARRSRDKASLDNERNADGPGAAAARRYLVVQIAGALARRIVCRVAAGDRLERGERYGMIMFGSRVDLYLPRGRASRRHRASACTAGETVLAEVPA